MADQMDIYSMALERARLRTGDGARIAEAARPTAGRRMRDLEIIFYGMMCFDPLPDRSGYRVLFPNGLRGDDGVPVHVPGLWVRDRTDYATARWPWAVLQNDFFLTDPRPHSLTITGLIPTPLADAAFDGHVAVLQQPDQPSLVLSDAPDTVIEMIVDHGTLSSHVGTPQGMIVVRWLVKSEAGTAIRFYFGDAFVEVPPTATQVYLANAGAHSGIENNDDHFKLYRRLFRNADADPKFQDPPNPPQPLGSVILNDETFKYRLECPDKVCSAVQTRLRVETNRGSHEG